MVNLDKVHASNAALVRSQPIVAVVVGGTAGIGECAVRELARTHAKHNGKGLRIYIVGRKMSSAEKIIADCTQLCPNETFRFVQASDLSLLKDVDKACAEIIQAEKDIVGPDGTPKIDLLVQTQGYLTFDLKPNYTSEGLDALMAITYYGRMRFVHQLLPLLTTSPRAGRVVSVWNPRLEGKVLPDDLSLHKPGNFGFSTAGSHLAQMTHFFFENVANRNPGKVALSHNYPGAVMTNAINNDKVPRIIQLLWKWIFEPLVRPFSLSFEDSGQRTVFHAADRFQARSEKAAPVQTEDGIPVAVSSDGTLGGGAYRTTWNGEIIPTGKAYQRAKAVGFYEKTWEHTMKVFEEIEAGRAFSGLFNSSVE